jgi:antibiotic biosynthesis monooxygenase (ABM) superfamily enzyme
VESATRLRTLLAGGPAAAPVPEPVTVTVARVVRPDRRQAFERWAAETLARAAAFPGNLGATLLHPGEGSSEYHLVYRFSDGESLAGWERSPQRRAALAQLARWSTRSATPGWPAWTASSPGPPRPDRAGG